MVDLSSPYRPGFNQDPPVLAGREGVLASIEEALATAAHDGWTPPPVLAVGARGVGKTVLLGRAGDLAGATFGWPRIHVEIAPGQPFTARLVVAAKSATSLLTSAPKSPVKLKETVLRAGVFGMGAELHFARDPAAPVVDQGLLLHEALREVADAAAARGAGFVLTLDELQNANREELTALGAILQEAVGARWPVVVVGAGLVAMRDPRHSVSYFERGTWHEIGVLGPTATREALTVPAAGAGRPFTDEAVAELARATAGYPYAVQLYGHHAWRASAGAPEIRLDAVERALDTAGRQLSQGLYASRWAHTSPREREYLMALSELVASGRPVTGGDVARHLGQAARAMSRVRASLLEKGTIMADGDALSFTIPGMAAYVAAQSDGAGS